MDMCWALPLAARPGSEKKRWSLGLVGQGKSAQLGCACPCRVFLSHGPVSSQWLCGLQRPVLRSSGAALLQSPIDTAFSQSLLGGGQLCAQTFRETDGGSDLA